MGINLSQRHVTLSLLRKGGNMENRVYHIFDLETISEFKELVIAIGEDLTTVQTWYTTAEAAEYLRCSTRTIGRARQIGTLRFERFDTGLSKGGIRYHRRWLDAFVLGFNARKLSPIQKRLLNDI